MGNNKEFQRDQKQQQPQADQKQQGGGRKNDEEVGEPIQLDDDTSPKQGQQGKPDMGQREGEHGGQHQGGTANR
jgi:hypothetical protein